MRILFLTHAFNSLTQRLYVELTALGHDISIEFDINDSVTVEAVELFKPHLILAPYLRRAIPQTIWREHVCLIVHPGIVGDRGPSALDWAILNGGREWGVTVLQAEAEMDAGPVWASETFPMRATKKSSLYRNEVTEAAVRAVKTAIERLPAYQAGIWQPQVVALRPMHALMQQADRAIDWARDSTTIVLAKLNGADGFPGVRDNLFGQSCQIYNGRVFPARGAPGEVLGRAGEGVVRATADGAVWIGHAKRLEGGIKLPVSVAFPEAAELADLDGPTQDIRYEEDGRSATSTSTSTTAPWAPPPASACWPPMRPRSSVPPGSSSSWAAPTFFSNGLDLNRIEAADSPPDESWRNINAMDDLCRDHPGHRLPSHRQRPARQYRRRRRFLALAADRVWARRGVILNPHYKNMGNLYGSEYWSYLLPRRVGAEKAARIMRNRLPLGAAEAAEMGFLDEAFGDDLAGFEVEIHTRAELSPHPPTSLPNSKPSASAARQTRPPSPSTPTGPRS
jgi:putative two-component system hydrogenase maturation factor HypX/HoxX